MRLIPWVPALALLSLYLPQAHASIQNSGNLLVVGRVSEMAQLELTQAAEALPLTSQTAYQPIARISVLHNTDLAPLSVAHIHSKRDSAVFANEPRIFSPDCDFKSTLKESQQRNCTIRATWKTRKNAPNGVHPIWVQVTISAI